ncbi:hypothetical protein EHQ68_04110 [Leptospira congkakensis]|uniref:Uncharacterized protein n=1 Tax=Leptospira congkakensis TaxID=2484932 RepID=A0A4Z1AHP8_9LEPT|nr:hypothetical protein EHQ69_11870 [Leptospira congkakensis]TGL91626.1 hypothetical protein EHQ68_04110 [Leptospira congkakensis]TGL98678.1 hypothetical protein EHQ70_03695 [Leptospira congkakensis]
MVWYNGTARDVVVGSGSCPPWSAIVSGLKLRGIDSPDGLVILILSCLFVKKKSNKAEYWFVLLDWF